MSQSSTRPAHAGGAPVVDVRQHVKWPLLDDADRAAVMAVLDRGVLSGPFAPEVSALQREFAEYLGARYCLATNSGTAALHIALAAVGVGPGDEVIVPAFTFVSTVNAFVLRGAKPVFADVRPDTLNLDERLVARLITRRTKAIVPVHYAGVPCNMTKLCVASEPKVPSHWPLYLPNRP